MQQHSILSWIAVMSSVAVMLNVVPIFVILLWFCQAQFMCKMHVGKTIIISNKYYLEDTFFCWHTEIVDRFIDTAEC